VKKIDLIQTLRNHLKRSGLSQEELAHRIGVSTVTVNRWLNGNITKMHKTTEMAIYSYLKSAGALK